MTSNEPKQAWTLTGTGYEFCNCDFGCGCNFGGFPNSEDGSCRAFVGLDIKRGKVGNVDVSGLKCAAIVNWPKAIHEGNGKAVFVVEPETTDDQINALAQVFSGDLGGMPWELLGPSFEVVGLRKTPITITGKGTDSSFCAEGVAEAQGTTFKNPVTGEPHHAFVDLPTGFIWTRGECGSGTFKASAEGVDVGASNSNWIYYNFDWSNRAA
ncbi:DUF1326 domain-containing protein [Halioxenophilus sp. WMMB6]|uniref:DUF1326 domain-containing protein n=1 Tax=Halioxenophilus sp. WMMB6 TaxID=3073815 RepID=UPI00295E8971|nr:DUF1326 domain-containing protein [Halioxenophilus sp. WMMB6]